MRRTGAKKRPYFRIVVTESRTARDSRFVEVLGHYDARTKPETLQIDRERLRHWLARGAQPSDTVRTLIARHPAAPQLAGAEPGGQAPGVRGRNSIMSEAGTAPASKAVTGPEPVAP